MFEKKFFKKNKGLLEEVVAVFHDKRTYTFHEVWIEEPKQTLWWEIKPEKEVDVHFFTSIFEEVFYGDKR